MNISFIVKASTRIGFGHLIRSRSLAHTMQALQRPGDVINFYVIGEHRLLNLLAKEHFNISLFETESSLIAAAPDLALGDVIIFDLLDVSDQLFELCRPASWLVSISPIFSHLNQMDAFFHRSHYFDGDMSGHTTVYKGLEYTIIQHGCKQIEAAYYKAVLEEERMSIAVSMGGGDAANKSLQVIKELNQLADNYTIWLMLGEGYQHSYDELIEESKNSHHEIILAKTNESMWKVLKQASLLVVPGGITTYEAAYAGLPTINILSNPKQAFLIQELVDANVADTVDDIRNGALKDKISFYHKNRRKLLDMHLQSKGLIDGQAGSRIYETILRK